MRSGLRLLERKHHLRGFVVICTVDCTDWLHYSIPSFFSNNNRKTKHCNSSRCVIFKLADEFDVFQFNLLHFMSYSQGS